ncbi:response regulator transcription factor [Sulfurimonas sp.]|uniref:response regulator transcription factor n=1 Tax=Sulfurimonas sp. TaxID=2022749 RepID=UPI0025D507C9|nr:response regulator transcription factor [Sulfurimonas sp.]MBT5933842.1 response regulator transcription factor [Sulfurimonas sp.]
MRILIAEDQKKISDSIKSILLEKSYEVEQAFDGEEAMDRLYAQHFDLLLLDIMMPKMDGITLIRELRASKNKIPTLMLTARDQINDRVNGLDSGADDYLSKPFSNLELLARVRSLLRRNSEVSSAVLGIKDLTLDSKTKEACRDGVQIKLTAKEFMILELFLHNADVTLTRLQISEHIWGESCMDRSTNAIDAHLKNLRRKIGDGIIETLHSIGYIARSK